MRHTPIREIANRLGLHCESDAMVAGFQVDSRKIEAGELFFALEGERVDGHLFLQDVAARGGLGAVVSNRYAGPSYGLVLLVVADVLEALQGLARSVIAESKALIVGITGSMGKTTTKDFTATLLEGKFRVGKTYSSYNTKLTLPITVLNLVGDEEVVVLEMGMGVPGDIAKLVDIAPPDIAVITQVTMAHYGEIFPGGTSGVARAKAEIFGSKKLKKAIFYCGLDAGVVDELTCEKISYSLKDRTADYFLAESVVDEKGIRAFKFDIPFREPHIQHNFLGAVAVARALKMSWEEIEAQVPKLKLPKMRFERLERNGVLFINDAYNANPESMKAALNCCPEPAPGGKRIAVLGRMVDLGPFSIASHEDVGRFAQEKVDHLLTLGGEARPLCDRFAEGKRPAEHFVDKRDLAKRLKELANPGDVVLVKGSRDLAMETLIEGA